MVVTKIYLTRNHLEIVEKLKPLSVTIGEKPTCSLAEEPLSELARKSVKRVEISNYHYHIETEIDMLLAYTRTTPRNRRCQRVDRSLAASNSQSHVWKSATVGVQISVFVKRDGTYQIGGLDSFIRPQTPHDLLTFKLEA